MRDKLPISSRERAGSWRKREILRRKEIPSRKKGGSSREREEEIQVQGIPLGTPQGKSETPGGKSGPTRNSLRK